MSEAKDIHNRNQPEEHENFVVRNGETMEWKNGVWRKVDPEEIKKQERWWSDDNIPITYPSGVDAWTPPPENIAAPRDTTQLRIVALQAAAARTDWPVGWGAKDVLETAGKYLEWLLEGWPE